MGTFSGDFDGIAKSIADDLTKQAASFDDLSSVVARYNRIKTTIEDEVRSCFSAIVGSKSNRAGYLKRGIRTYYLPDEGGVVITVDSKALVRRSFSPDTYGHIKNIIALIASGYSLNSDTGPWGIWHNKRISGLAKREPYTRYNFLTNGGSSSVYKNTTRTITSASRAVKIGYTVDVMLDKVQKTLAANSIPANITLGDEFLGALQDQTRPTRTTLSNASDQL